MPHDKQCEFSPDIEDESTWDMAYGACKGNGQPGATTGIGRLNIDKLPDDTAGG